jgi:hypothetical protein
MDLNVKLQGLKYNLEKIQGVKCKNATSWDFLEFLELFYNWKNHGIDPRDSRPGAPHCSVGAVHGSLNPDERGSSP